MIHDVPFPILRYIPTRKYKLCVLTLAGDLIARFTPEPDPGFGVRNVTWHPNGLFLLVAGWDDKVGLLRMLPLGKVLIIELGSHPGQSQLVPCGFTRADIADILQCCKAQAPYCSISLS